jgi:hypothetical protein
MYEFEREIDEQLQLIREKIIQSVKDNDPEYLDYGQFTEDLDELENIYSLKLEEVED